MLKFKSEIDSLSIINEKEEVIVDLDSNNINPKEIITLSKLIMYINKKELHYNMEKCYGK